MGSSAICNLVDQVINHCKICRIEPNFLSKNNLVIFTIYHLVELLKIM